MHAKRGASQRSAVLASRDVALVRPHRPLAEPRRPSARGEPQATSREPHAMSPRGRNRGARHVRHDRAGPQGRGHHHREDVAARGRKLAQGVSTKHGCWLARPAISYPRVGRLCMPHEISRRSRTNWSWTSPASPRRRGACQALMTGPAGSGLTRPRRELPRARALHLDPGVWRPRPAHRGGREWRTTMARGDGERSVRRWRGLGYLRGRPILAC